MKRIHSFNFKELTDLLKRDQVSINQISVDQISVDQIPVDQKTKYEFILKKNGTIYNQEMKEKFHNFFIDLEKSNLDENQRLKCIQYQFFFKRVLESLSYDYENNKTIITPIKIDTSNKINIELDPIIRKNTDYSSDFIVKKNNYSNQELIDRNNN